MTPRHPVACYAASPEADEMMNWLMDSWYASFKELIVQGILWAAGRPREIRQPKVEP